MKKHPCPIFPIKNQISRRQCLLAGVMLLGAALLCGLLLFWYFRTVRYHSDQARRNDIRALAQEEYNGLFLSMFPAEPFNAENFSYYRGIPTLKACHRFETLADIGDYLRTALDGGQEITSIYIGLDAPAIAGQYGFHASLYHREYQKQLLQLVSANPQTTFEILLPYYSLAYWDSLSADRRAEYINSYRNLVNIFIGQPNVAIYFLGHEEWLVANPGNYDAPDSCNPSVTSALLLMTFQDDEDNGCALTPDNMEERFAALEALIASRAGKGEHPFSPPDLSSCEIIFFGDSVIGNFTDSLSIPGVVQGLSGAHTFNLGRGGSHAIMNQDSSFPSLNTIVDALLAKNAELLAPDNDQPYAGLLEYLENTASEDAGTNVKTCFVINYGLNDFFSGSPIDSEDPWDICTYKGSLRTAVAKLREAYPDSMVILDTPNFCTYFGNGTQPQGEQGGKMTDYVNAVQEICDELGVYCVDNYNNLGINAKNQEEYLVDGCHPNELGRYLIAQHILQAIESELER